MAAHALQLAPWRRMLLTGLALLRRSFGGLCLLGAVLTVLALISFDISDPSFNNATDARARNLLGVPGAYWADLLLQSFGLAAWLLVFALAAWGARALLGLRLAWPWLPLAALPLALITLAGALALRSRLPEAWPIASGLGGVVGVVTLSGARAVLGGWAASALLLSGGVLSLTALGLRWQELAASVIDLRHRVQRLRGLQRQHVPLGRAVPGQIARLSREGWQRGRASLAQHLPEPRRVVPAQAMTVLPRADQPERNAGQALRRLTTLLRDRHEDEHDAPTPLEVDVQASSAPPRAPAVPARPQPRIHDAEPVAPPPPRPARMEDDAWPLDALGGEFALPPLDLLDPPNHAAKPRVNRTELADTAVRLETVLGDFGVKGSIVDISPGPVITRYDLEPARGVRAARVINLAEDIARSMCVDAIRIAPVSGTTYIGVELPNHKREVIALRELLEGELFEKTAQSLALALGKDIAGKPMIADLQPMPHLLIAGTTGSGKSVSLNAMILSLLYRLPPDRCKLIMIDPKFIELSIYEGIPHLLAPVVTEPAKAIQALKWVVREMEERYRLMAHLRVRNIQQYNQRVQQALQDGEVLERTVQTGFEPGTGEPIYESQQLDMTPLPAIVVIVDEVADLMLSAGKEVEVAIQRLSQKARAAGIHLIIATQRPSVDVITGVIKANLPSRISFRVSSKHDSMTVLNQPGAEHLLGKGDMLMGREGRDPVRVHGPLVSEAEIERVVAYLKTQGEPDYISAVTEESEPGAATGGGSAGGLDDGDDSDNALFQRAVRVVVADNKASTSYVQRKLRIGYNSAARLIERMEEEGIVSPPTHNGKRSVLVNEEGH